MTRAAFGGAFVVMVIAGGLLGSGCAASRAQPVPTPSLAPTPAVVATVPPRPTPVAPTAVPTAAPTRPAATPTLRSGPAEGEVHILDDLFYPSEITIRVANR
jgi:hypothetical protein